MADEFRGGTSAGGVTGDVTGDVTGSELAEVCQQSHVSVMGRNKRLQRKLISCNQCGPDKWCKVKKVSTHVHLTAPQLGGWAHALVLFFLNLPIEQNSLGPCSGHGT